MNLRESTAKLYLDQSMSMNWYPGSSIEYRDVDSG